MLRSIPLFISMLSLLASLAVPTSLSGAAEAAVEEAAPDFGGGWYSHFGYLELVQTGKEVRGTYSCCQGEIHGQILGPMLEFFWKDPVYGEGWGHFYLREEGRRIVGGWGNQDDMGVQGPWNAVRYEEPVLPGEGVSFRVESRHSRYGDLEATARLVFSGDQVRGVLRGAYRMTVREQPFRQEVFHLLKGRSEGDRLTLEWRDPIDGETGKIALTRRQDRLEGTWRAEGSGTSENISFFATEPLMDDSGEVIPPSRQTAVTPESDSSTFGDSPIRKSRPPLPASGSPGFFRVIR